MINKLRF